MENKINLVEILKDCPMGMELDCTIYDDVILDDIDNSPEHEYPIRIATRNGYLLNLTKYGTYTDIEEAKCVIFPKGKTTWEGFVPPCNFKDGDVLISAHGKPFILKKIHDNKICESYCGIRQNGEFVKESHNWTSNYNLRLATDEEKQKLFDAIKANGYKWNEETKTLEKLLRFKVGNVIQCMDYKVKITEVNIEDECYEYESIFAKGIGSIEFSEQDNWELIPNKFDINDLKPFDRVLVRYHKNNKWCGSLFSHIDSDFHSHCYKYVTIAGKSYPMCIPYKGNEHLLGETDDCDEYFKNWER